ncbi:MAG: glycoside hydrolase family 95 protein [Tannerellaceae bacterium]|jgi:alpha-L-fucosidase 2|nr:glycoside hydrolase family 95 protein [Tannerellaceae bacterium]
MNKQFIKGTILMAAALLALLPAIGHTAERNPMTIWYDNKPGEGWTDPLPVGNGLIGALVYGKASNERIALNESSFWSGRPHDYNDPEAGKYFTQVKDLIFAGKFKDAEKLADEKFYGKPVGQQAYEPLGDLRMIFYGIDENEVGNYQRDLDMENGITSVSFAYRGVKYRREVFVSYPDRILVMRITADKPGHVSFDAWLDSHFKDRTIAQNGQITLDGAWENTIPHYWLIGDIGAEKGMAFQTVVQVRNEGGTIASRKDRLAIRNADAATLILSAGTSHINYKDISGDPSARNQKVLADIAGKDYASLRQRHTSDFSSLMSRVAVITGDATRNEIPVNKRIAAINNGETDANLEALCFQFGRYMLVSSSRKGGQPANLQAIWNERLSPPWGSKYTININTQMNYWPAEVTNLGECHAPLVEMVKDLAENGRKTAEIYYNAPGWVTHHNVDLWRGTAPVDGARFGLWPVGGAWLCQHLWERYAFTADKEVLKEIYPILKGSAEFLSSILVEYPRYGCLVTPVSMSPEHGYYTDDGNTMSYLSPGPTMDIAIIRELFPHVIEASRILGVDAPLRKRLEAIMPKLPPYKVNQLGYVQEWIEDWRPQRGGHDVSPYFPFYPGSSILLHRDSDIDLVKAYTYWLEARGLRGGGFPGSWNICMWARLERGDRTGALMQAAVAANASHFLRQGTGAQVDAPFGFTAAVAESLIQSHAGEISLLPALPSGWAASGEVKGLCARGGYTVNMKWAKGRLVRAEIFHPGGGSCNVRYNGRVARINVPKGQPAILD